MHKFSNLFFYFLLHWAIVSADNRNKTGTTGGLGVSVGLSGKPIQEFENNKEINKKNFPAVITTEKDEEKNPTNLEIDAETEEALKKIANAPAFNEHLEGGSKYKVKYKSFDELEKDLKTIGLKMKTDPNFIANLLDGYQKFITGEIDKNDFNKVLDDLVFYMHQYDNSLNFIKIKGIELMILPIIVNQTDTEIRTKALKIVGALVQNNLRAQVLTFGKNVVPHLTQILLSSSNPDELSACLNAISCLLRQYPYAQIKILPTVGLKSMAKLMTRETEFKVKLKVLILISDLLIEKDGVIEDQIRLDIPPKLILYNQVNLTEWLNEINFCKIAMKFVIKNKNEVVMDPYQAEHLVDSFQALKKICLKEWRPNASLRKALFSLEEIFKGVNESYSIEIANKIGNLNQQLYPKSKRRKNDEL